MRFLCLHGVGSNNQIFKVQTAAFRYELGDQHTYEFVQGVIPCDLPQELTALSNSSNQHYSYYDTKSNQSFVDALNSLEAYIETEGPFDGVVAFSQGAGLVAMLLVRREYLFPHRKDLFRCAVLFSPGHVFDPLTYVQTGEVRVLDRIPLGMSALTLPVAIIYGQRDVLRDGCSQLGNLWDPDVLSVSIHEGGHEIPGLGAKASLPEAVKMARRAITRAELSSHLPLAEFDN